VSALLPYRLPKILEGTQCPPLRQKFFQKAAMAESQPYKEMKTKTQHFLKEKRRIHYGY
jgi:hypothetical protein